MNSNQTPNQAGAPRQTPIAPIKLKNNRWMQYLKWFIFFVCGILIFYSVAPWQSAGNAIGNAIVSLAIVAKLQTVPLLGLAVSLIVWILPSAMAIFLWALTQLIEITPVLLHDRQIMEAVVKELKTQPAQPAQADTKAEKFQKKTSNFVLDILRNIGLYAALAYVAELAVNVWYYLPYGNGWNDFVRDFLVWDASLIRWGEFGLMIGSIAIVEVLVLFMLNVHRFFEVVNPKTERRI